MGRNSRAEQTNYTPVRAVAQRCIIPTEAPLSHRMAWLWPGGAGTDEQRGPQHSRHVGHGWGMAGACGHGCEPYLALTQ